MDKFRRISVVGTGVMGAGISQTCAQAGYPTLMLGQTAEDTAKGMAGIERELGRLVERERISEGDRGETLSRIMTGLDFAAASECDLVIEAVVESLEVKKDVFRRLDSVCHPDTILASDTATLPISELANVTSRPDKVVGLHMLSPVPSSKVVELINTGLSSEETIEKSRVFCESLGKAVVMVKDSPGFIINRLLAPYLLEAILVLEQDVASREEIDASMNLGCGHPVGPLRLLDLVGLDQFHDLASSLFRLLKDPKYEPPALLTQMVERGLLGRKSGEGFYQWT